MESIPPNDHNSITHASHLLRIIDKNRAVRSEILLSSAVHKSSNRVINIPNIFFAGWRLNLALTPSQMSSRLAQIPEHLTFKLTFGKQNINHVSKLPMKNRNDSTKLSNPPTLRAYADVSMNTKY